MLKVSATKLRDHLFDYLEQAAAGKIIIQRNNQAVARLMPLQQPWRAHMTITPRLLVTPEELCQPLDDLPVIKTLLTSC